MATGSSPWRAACLPGRTLRRRPRHCSGRLSVHILSAISRVIKIPLPTRLNPPTHWHTTHPHTLAHTGRASAFKHFNLPMWPQLLPPRRHCRHTLDLGTSPGYSARQSSVIHSHQRIRNAASQKITTDFD